MTLEELCNLPGVSGDEHRVREYLRGCISEYADDIKTDTMGNMTAFRKGRNSSRTVALFAHMDEVGLIISGITEKGYLKFKTVGGIDTRVIISKRVRIADRIIGVTGIKAIHLVSREERENVPKVRDMYIDIGASSEEEAKKYVSIGDYAAFDTVYEEFGDGKIKAKAIDDRAGCYILASLIKEKPEYDTYYCFTVQEETGLRGARCTAFGIEADAALVIEATTCSDTFGTRPHQQVTVCGGGAAVSFMDRTTIVNDSLHRGIMECAKKRGIKVQYKAAVAGGNDAGIIHLSRTGIMTASVSVPARYIHSPVSVASKSDINACADVARMFIEMGGRFANA